MTKRIEFLKYVVGASVKMCMDLTQNYGCQSLCFQAVGELVVKLLLKWD